MARIRVVVADDHSADDVSILRLLTFLCNTSPSFVEKHWVETPESVRQLMATSVFKGTLKYHQGVSLTYGHIVSALFRARESEADKTKRMLP